jgi:hypothetical protein
MTGWSLQKAALPVAAPPPRLRSKPLSRAQMHVLARRLFVARCRLAPRAAAAADVLVKRRSPASH